MELWIRSQSREQLEKVNKLEIIDCTQLTKTIENSVFNFMKDNEQIKQYIRDGFSIKANETIFATYDTKERALEVLDDIQVYLEKMGTNEILTDKIGIMNGIKHYGIVYEMPKE